MQSRDLTLSLLVVSVCWTSSDMVLMWDSSLVCVYMIILFPVPKSVKYCSMVIYFYCIRINYIWITILGIITFQIQAVILLKWIRKQVIKFTSSHIKFAFIICIVKKIFSNLRRSVQNNESDVMCFSMWQHPPKI